MRIAILILAHKNQTQLERLVKRLNNPEIDIYIHADKKFKVKNIDNTKMIKHRFNIKWGDISLANAINSSLYEILNDKYSHYILISGQDYPLISSKELLDYLKNIGNKSLISYKRIGHGNNEWNVENRYKYYHFRVELIDKLSSHIYHNRKFIEEYIPYGGSAWWILSNDAAKYLTKTYKNLKISKKMRRTSCIDEIIFQTILCNSKFKNKLINNESHFVSWEEHIKGLNKGNPDILTSKDFDKIIASKKLFARKFDSDKDENIMNMIDEYIDNKKEGT